MTDCDAMLAAILSDPADDLPRLMYADWLDENGESERSEFVRVQVELSRYKHGTGKCPTCRVLSGEVHKEGCEYFRLKTKENDTAHKYILGRGEWNAPIIAALGLQPLQDDFAGQWYWVRGFVASVRLSWKDWLHHHEALYWHPKQTVECPKCNGRGGYDEYRGIGEWDWASCPPCESTGRISRPFVATAHPITKVELTTWMPRVENIVRRDHGEADSFFTLLDNDERLTFTRVKCSTCDGWRRFIRALLPRVPTLSEMLNSPTMLTPPPPLEPMTCPDCNGEPLNEWYCDRWPTITFKIP